MVKITTKNSQFKTTAVCYPVELKSAIAEAMSKIGTSVKFENPKIAYDIEFSCADSFTIFAGDEFVGIGEVYLTPDMIRQSRMEMVDSLEHLKK